MSDAPELSDPAFAIADEELVYSGVVIDYFAVTMVDPNGERHRREVARHPGAVAVVPIVDDEVVLIRQYRVAVDDFLLELPAGKLDIAGEDPADAAQRELIEEVGYRAQNLDKLGVLHNSPGFCDEMITIYLGTDLDDVGRAADGSEEHWSTLHRVPLDQVPALVTDGSITDAKTLIGLQWMLSRT